MPTRISFCEASPAAATMAAASAGDQATWVVSITANSPAVPSAITPRTYPRAAGGRSCNGFLPITLSGEYRIRIGKQEGGRLRLCSFSPRRGGSIGPAGTSGRPDGALLPAYRAQARTVIHQTAEDIVVGQRPHLTV